MERRSRNVTRLQTASFTDRGRRHIGFVDDDQTRGGLMAHVVANKQSLTLTIPAENLPAGNYEVMVSGVPLDGPVEFVGSYFIKVERRQ